MKRRRPRQTILSDLESLRQKRARIEEKLRRVDGQIKDDEKDMRILEREEKEARAITIPWPVFAEAVRHTIDAWKYVDNGDTPVASDCHNPFGCWHTKNAHTRPLQLYRLTTLCGISVTLCGTCVISHPTVSGVVPVEYKVGKYGQYRDALDTSTVCIDPDDYERDIADYLRRVAKEWPDSNGKPWEIGVTSIEDIPKDY